MNLFIQMIRQVQLFHNLLGYVHRDIKPDNFRVDSDGRVWLIDFASAAKIDITDKQSDKKKQSTLDGGTLYTSSVFVLKG